MKLRVLILKALLAIPLGLAACSEKAAPIPSTPAWETGGLREVFLSSMWTLTYRELRPVEVSEKEPRPVPGLDASGLEAASVA